jgi:hypothetical protein
MILVCLCAQAGQYRLEDEAGNLLTPVFYSAPDPPRVAQRIADSHGVDVTLEVCANGNEPPRVQTFSPAASRRGCE